MSDLTGTVSGESRIELVTRARERAEQWFGRTKCVAIKLGPAIDETIAAPHYTATYTADVAHRWEAATYGPTKCGICKEPAPR